MLDLRVWANQNTVIDASTDSLGVPALDAELVWLLVHYPDIYDLDNLLQPLEHWLHVRIAELPVRSTCLGSEAACRYRYLLTLEPDPVGYNEPVFDLGTHYRLRPVRWLPPATPPNDFDDYMTARLLVDIWPIPDSLVPFSFDQLPSEVIDLSPEGAVRYEFTITDRTLTARRQ